jgi:toxin ParE1/3/4
LQREIIVRPEARADLIGIWNYTSNQWGNTQADLYLREISEQISALALRPNKGRVAERFHPSFRMLRIRKHRLFYSDDGVSVEVIRILHEQMNIPHHLA